MSLAALMPLPRYQAFDSSGNPLSGALLYTYAVLTTTPQATYSDSALTVANANPVVADSGGLFGAIYLASTAYKFVLKTAAGVTVWTQDNVLSTTSPVQLPNVTAYGTAASGTALQAAVTAIGSTVTTLFVTDTIVASADTTVPGNITLAFLSPGMLSPATGKVITVQGPIQAGAYKIFTGAGTIAWTGAATPVAQPQWWGAGGRGTTDDTTAIQAAVTSLFTGGGGVLFFPRGVYQLSTTITVSQSNKGITFRGEGASEAGGTSAATVLKWTGGASIVIDVGTDTRNVNFEDFDFENTGTCTAFVRVGFTDMTRFHNINARPTTFPSTAAFILGISTSRCENTQFDNVTIRGTAAGQVGISADRAQDLRGYRLNLVYCRLVLGIAGSMDIVNAAFSGSTFNTIVGDTNAAVQIIQGRSVAFHGCHFEVNDTNLCAEITSTGIDKRGVLFSGCYFVSGGTATYATRINYSTADVTFVACTTVQFANPYYLVRNTSAGSVTLIGNSMNGTGAALVSDNTNVTALSNIVNGIKVANLNVPAQTLVVYTPADTTPSVLGASSLYVANAGAVIITNLDDGVDGQQVTLIFADANTTVNRDHAYLSGGANFVSTAQDTLTLIYRQSSTQWHEVSRSLNS